MPYDYMDTYSRKKFGSENDYNNDLEDLKEKAGATTLAGKDMVDPSEGGGGSKDWSKMSPEFAQGASRGASGGVGSALLSGGIMSANPYAAGAGIGLMALEGDAQAKAKEQEAQQLEAQQRKQQQLSAINSLMAVSRGLTVTG